jgi:hypothetical protein
MESSIPYLKIALRDRLIADPGIDAGTTVVSVGNPHPDDWGYEAIIIGAMSEWSHTHVAAMTQENEEYKVEILVNVVGTPMDAYDALQMRAYALASIVRESVETWTRDGGELVTGDWGHVDQVMPADDGHDIEGLDETGRDSSVVFNVEVRARLVSNG